MQGRGKPVARGTKPMPINRPTRARRWFVCIWLSIPVFFFRGVTPLASRAAQFGCTADVYRGVIGAHLKARPPILSDRTAKAVALTAKCR